MNINIKYILLGIVIGGLGVWLTQINTKNATPNKSEVTNSIDAHFIEQMIPHHEDAITMAKSAETKAEHKEIKDLAKNIINDQSREIKQMQDWYKSWFGQNITKSTTMMGNHGMMTPTSNEEDMGGESGNFDKVFIEEMITHHEMAVMMANMLKNGTGRSEMKQLAEDIITAQTKEINQMSDWYKNWGYGNK